jgi:hypothetical protein
MSISIIIKSRIFSRLPSLLCLALLLFATAAPARADSLDFVLDVLYKGGVVDGNVKAAKPLISCLAAGKSVADCTLGAAGQTELAQDPQVHNVIDIYQSFQQKDWYGVLKKAGVTVGCALVPGGEIKDALCGEIGKIAIAVINGVGSVLSSIGDAVSSLFGADEKEVPPMWDEDYYRLFFAPTYHKLIMALDADDGSFEPIVQNVYAGCKAYYGRFEQTATNGCEVNRSRLGDQAKFLRKTLLAEGESWFHLQAEPKLDAWAHAHYGENAGNYIAAQVAQCRDSVVKAIALPNPGFDRCAAFKTQLPQNQLVAAGIAEQMDAQCQAEAKALDVPPPHDAYEMACKPVQQKLQAGLAAATSAWKQRMDLAKGAGCWNEGTPDTIHCDTYASQLACVKAIPDKASICGFDIDKADQAFAQEIFATLYKDTADAGKPQHCLRTGAKVLCFRPVKQQGCRIYVMMHGAKYGLGSEGDAICELQSDAEYDALKNKAAQILVALNAPQGRATALAIRNFNAPQLRSAVRHTSEIQLAAPLTSDIDPDSPCTLADNDPLKIECRSGFQWDALPARVAKINAILGSTFGFCGADYETDGADLPCLAGADTGAFPKGSGSPPPAQPPVQPRLQLPPAVDKQHPPKNPPLRIRQIAPVKDADGR